MTLQFVVVHFFAIFAISVWIAFSERIFTQRSQMSQRPIRMDDPSIRRCPFLCDLCVNAGWQSARWRLALHFARSVSPEGPSGRDLFSTLKKLAYGPNDGTENSRERKS